ncbi:MAG: hypothetical protein RMJ55_05765 [Roseiflexaceae bacterium]|nr:hypothetical protein [Roseiflexaceae bacterium]
MWRASLDTLLPERQMPLDARAITLLADGTLRVVLIWEGDVLIGRLDGDRFISETTLAGVPARANLVGEWYGNELLLRSESDAWLITIVEGEANERTTD